VDGRLPFLFKAIGSKIRYMTGHAKRLRAWPLFNIPEYNASKVAGNRVHSDGASPGSRPKDGDV
jgi:hypothetical protein